MPLKNITEHDKKLTKEVLMSREDLLEDAKTKFFLPPDSLISLRDLQRIYCGEKILYVPSIDMSS